MERYDIVVLGGGAAGLMAAVSAAEAGNGGLRVSVLEGNARVGKKLLATGNGRCNLSNRFVAPTHYHGDVSRAAGLLKRFPTEKVIGQFAHLGLLCRELDEGRILSLIHIFHTGYARCRCALEQGVRDENSNRSGCPPAIH